MCRAAWFGLAASALAAVVSLGSCAFVAPAPPADVYIAARLAPPPAVAATGPDVQAAGRARPATQPEAALPLLERVPAAGPIAVTVDESILLALGNNRALAVERLNPRIRRTFEQVERSAFDPLLVADASVGRVRAPIVANAGDDQDETAVNLHAGAVQQFPTGTRVQADFDSELLSSSIRDDRRTTRLGLTVTQALLRGAGLDVNLASIRQARLDSLASEYELRGFAEALVAQTEQTYWDCVLAQRTIEIVADSMQLAQRQIQETRDRVEVGQLARTELAAAEAEVARRREELINARSRLATLRLRLLRLMSPPGDGPAAALWDRPLVLLSRPATPELALDDVDVHVAIAMRLRPELNQARLLIRRGQLELVKTRNGLLPRLDLFVTLGKSGYAESFGRDLGNLFDDDRFDALAGASFAFPPANRQARALHRRAGLDVEQSQRALANLAQLVQLDVRAALIEVGRTGEQIAATAATSRLGQETLRAETEKFGVGKSTTFLVAQAQRDLLAARIAEVAAVVDHLKALVELHRQDGSLLQRRGIIAPGEGPADWPGGGGVEPVGLAR